MKGPRPTIYFLLSLAAYCILCYLSYAIGRIWPAPVCPDCGCRNGLWNLVPQANSTSSCCLPPSILPLSMLSDKKLEPRSYLLTGALAMICVANVLLAARHFYYHVRSGECNERVSPRLLLNWMSRFRKCVHICWPRHRSIFSQRPFTRRYDIPRVRRLPAPPSVRYYRPVYNKRSMVRGRAYGPSTACIRTHNVASTALHPHPPDCFHALLSRCKRRASALPCSSLPGSLQAALAM